MRDYTMERNHISAKLVTSVFVYQDIYENMRCYTLDRSVMNARCVGKVILAQVALGITAKHT